jgi:cytochrome P450
VEKERSDVLPPDFFFTPEFGRDPYAIHKKLRERGPVHRVDFPEGHSGFLVVDYEHVQAALNDPRLSKDIHKGPKWFRDRMLENSAVLSHNMVVADPPDHRRLRRPASRTFTGRRIAELRQRIQEITDDLIDTFPQSGEIDLIQDFAVSLPLQVICELFGVSVENRARFREWAAVLLLSSSATEGDVAERRRAASSAVTEYFAGLMARRRDEPGEDLVSELLRAMAGPDALSEQEVISTLVMILIAGHETTLHLIGNGTVALLTHPDQLQLLKADPDLIPDAVEELLRYDGPIERATVRFAAEDLELAGVRIPKGSFVHLSVAASARDPKIFPDPDRFDITRPDNRHMGFGHGPHTCLGAPLARMEGQIAFATLLHRVPDIELAVPPDELEWLVDTSIVRGLERLPVRTGTVRPRDFAPLSPAGKAAR